MGDERLVGTWQLAATEVRDVEGKVTGEAFPGWIGQIVYAADGYMSVQLMGPDRPLFEGVDRLSASPEQRQRAFDTYIAYYGTYRVDDQEGVVTHEVIGSSSPTLVGVGQRRHFRLEGDQLTLSPPPRQADGARSYLTWQRVRPR